MSRVRYEYGCWMLAVDLDPDLPHPNRADIALDWQYRWLKQWDDPNYKGPRNYAWDSSTGWTGQHLLNYRRDHFQTVDNPLTFDARTGRLCQLKALHDWSFAKVHAGLVRAKGGLICANTSPMATLLYGQFMDVLVREEPAGNIRPDAALVLRMLAYHKPVAYYQPPEDASPVRLAMFYGFAPGIDATREQMRRVARQYMPIIETIDRAGWEPVTHARGDGLMVERYGRKAGELYFTVRIDGKAAQQKQAILKIDAKALGIDPAEVMIEEIAERRDVQRDTDADSLVLRLAIDPDQTLVLAVREAATSRFQKGSIPSLIDKLEDTAEGGIGYMATMTGGGFLPLGTGSAEALLLGQVPAVPSTTMCELVKQGAAAVPYLITHLDDKRATKITIKHHGLMGGLFFNDEYDFNNRTTKEPPVGVNQDLGNNGNGPKEHTVTVGDLCFVALGQIVNRQFNAVRYQPTMCIMINSPTYSPVLREAIRKEWSNLTPERHKASLVQDFLYPDFEQRRIEASSRLGYYYPDVLEPLVLKQLAEPRYNVFKVQALVRERLYRTQDARDRKRLFDDFVAQRGDVARAGILVYLFDDLKIQEADERGSLSPPLKEKYAARACLVQLYGCPVDVRSQDRPHLLPVENCAQARFIEAILHFPTPKITEAVRAIMHSTEEEYLAEACAKYLAHQGKEESGDSRKEGR